MAKKPGALTPGGGKGAGKGGGGKGGPPAVHHRHPHHHHPPSLGGPMTPGGGHTGAPAKPAPKAHKARHHPKVRHHPKAKAHPKRKLAGAPLGGGWILGGNDVADNCAAVAVANALLGVTGHRMSDAQLLELHDRAGPLSIAEALAALGASFTELQTQPGGRSPWPVVAGLATPHGPHAALLLGDQFITWGGVLALPDDWDIEEIWAVTW
jgi:hypothetical protein